MNSGLFQNLTKVKRIKIQLSSVEVQSPIGVGKRYHALLRRVYLAVRKSYPKLGERMAL